MKLKAIISILAIATAISGAAQFPSLNTFRYDFLRDAISPAVKVLRTTYVMADSELTQRYAATNDTVYGYDYSLAYQTPAGFIVPDAAINPWNADPQFEYYRDNADYVPLFNDRTFSPLAEAPVYKPLAARPFEMPDSIGKRSGLFLLKTVETPAGTMQAGASNDSKGMLVTFYRDRNRSLEQSTDLTIKFENYTPEFDRNGFSTVNSLPSSNRELMGGLYIVPVANDNGTIVLRIAGVMARLTPRSSSWRMVRVPTFDDVEAEVVTDEGAETVEPAAPAERPDALKPIGGSIADDLYDCN